ncbi:MAG: ATP-binding protein [Cyanobacteria bacterium J06627_28]
MKTAAMSPLSLQASLASLQPPPAAVSVDPRGFKTALQSFVQFLVTHQVQATLWLKLPKDDAWWQDIWQYGHQAAGSTIYTLGEQTGTPPESLAASLRPIPIEQTAELKREYLCVAVAENFVGVLLAARIAPGTPTPDKRTLNLYSSITPRTVAAVSHGIKAVIESNLPAELQEMSATDGKPTVGAGAGADRTIAGAAALSQWDRCFPESLMNRVTMPLAETFLTWQVQFQEDLRSQLNEYRSAQKNNKPSSALAATDADFLNQARQKLHAPLTTIKTALTLLGSNGLKLAQRERYLDMISAQCEHQEALINSITQLLQVQGTRSEPSKTLMLSDLIPGIVSTYQPIAEERGIMLAYTVPADLSAVVCAECELKQVVIQLLQNGIQITPKGGRVWVAARTHSDKFVALTVQDSGCGIAKDDIDGLFEAFSQTSGSDSKGAGLGLTLVKQLVTKMGGSISVDSTPNSGTTFTLLLPTISIAKDIPRETKTAQEQPSRQSSAQRQLESRLVHADARASNQPPTVAPLTAKSHPDFLAGGIA